MQDSKGFIWITSDGLFKFDGVQAIHYFHDAKIPTSLPNNNIKSICEAPDGSIWLGTMYGISRYSPQTNHFKNYFFSQKSNRNIDNRVFVDKKGTVWVGNRMGIAKFFPAENKYYSYPLIKYQKDSFPLSSFITYILQDKNDSNYLWLGTFNALIHFNKINGEAKYFYFSTSSTCPITSLYYDKSNRLWVCTWGNGIGMFNTQNFTFQFKLFTKDLKKGNTNITNAICEQKINEEESKYYLSTEKGLITFTLSSRDSFNAIVFSTPYLHSIANMNSIGGLPNGIIRSEEGIIWITTNNDLSYIIPQNQLFFQKHLPIGNAFSFTKGNITKYGKGFWMSSWYQNGLKFVDNNLQKVHSVHFLNSISNSFYSKQINDVLDLGNQLWIATMGGLFLYNKHTKEARAFLKNNSSVPNDRVISLCYDHYNHQIWAGTYSHGYFILNPKTFEITQLTSYNKNSSLGRVYTIFEDSQKHIWIGKDDTLLKYNEQDYSLAKYYNIRGDGKSLARGNIVSIVEDSRNKIWIGTSDGLNCYNNTTNSFELFTTSDGLSNNTITDLTLGKYNHLWIATAKGLNKLDLSNNKIKIYYNQNGIYDDKGITTLFQNYDNNLVVANYNMLNILSPNTIKSNNRKPLVYINSIKINNLNKTIYINKANKTIHLKYNQNYFTLDFIALSYINAQDNKYACQLIGINNNMVQLGKDHTISYSNISPGEYTFRVIASNSDGVWNTNGSQIKIIIAPPFWKTKWFIILCILLTAFLIYSIYRYRINQILKLERIRTKISTDLHDEIGSTLSAISILGNMAKEENDAKYTTQFLEEINTNTSDLLQKMDDIVWSINPKNDSLKILLIRIKVFASRLFEAKGIEYEINFPHNIDSVKLSMEKRQHLYLILKECITNIIKHADSSYAQIQSYIKDKKLNIIIKDNGKGFDTANNYMGNGLLSLKNRAKLINAKLTIASEINKGTEVSINLKLI